MIKAIFFDCFGVLMLDSCSSLSELFSEHRPELDDITKMADRGMIGRSEQITKYSELVGWSPEQVEQYLEREHQLNQPLVDLMEALEPCYHLGMISNIGRGWFDSMVPSKVRDMLEQTVLSGEVGVVKPYPEIFELFCSKANVEPSQCVFIDDLISNVEGAKAAGMSAIWYKEVGSLKQELSQLKIDI